MVGMQSKINEQKLPPKRWEVNINRMYAELSDG